MIKRGEEAILEIKERPYGGVGQLKKYNLFMPEEMKSKQVTMVAKVVLEPGCSLGPHPHVEDEEIYYILTGEGLFDDNGVTYKVGPGDAMITGAGESHALKNIGQEPLTFLALIHKL